MTTSLNDQTTADAHDWPDGVTARILTRVGLHLGDLNATVDIHDDPPGHNARSRATCQPCGRDYDHGLTYRYEVLDWAQTHAHTCTALPKPTNPSTGGTRIQPAIHHSA